MMMLAMTLSWDLFNGNELKERGNPSISPNTRHVGKHAIFPSAFQTNSNFSLIEFKELCFLVVLIINKNARSTSLLCIISGHPLKLMSE